MPEDLAQWRTTAVGELLGLRNPDGGWPYRAGLASGLEPTALAALAGAGAGEDILAATADWLMARQQQDGFFTASPPNEAGSWLTSLGAMAVARLGRLAGVEVAGQALLATAVYAFTQHQPGIYGYDTTLTGWPWSVGAFSFVEPTALAVLFLKQAGHGGHDRVQQGVGLLRDRAFKEGGWNYGEPEVLGGRLYPAEALLRWPCWRCPTNRMSRRMRR